jgi:hypothetical protein
MKNICFTDFAAKSRFESLSVEADFGKLYGLNIVDHTH